MLSVVRLGCLYFCRSGHPVISPDQFLNLVGHLLPQEPYLDLPRITGRDLQEVARAKKSTAGGLMVGRGTRSRRCRCPGFLVLLFSWSWLNLLVLGLRVFGMPTFAMIPKADGDSAP